jgi:hypothetical protein
MREGVIQSYIGFLPAPSDKRSCGEICSDALPTDVEDKVLARSWKQSYSLVSLFRFITIIMASRTFLASRLTAPGRLRPVYLTQKRLKATAPFKLPDPRNEPNVSVCVHMVEFQRAN